MNILDQYVTRIPSDQNVLDLFDGEWSSRMPQECGLASNPGVAALFDDARIVWAEKMLGGFADRDILELGPLECGHTYMMHQRGARSITAIEANSRAFLRCLCIKELFGLQRAALKLGDFTSYLRHNTRKFDMTVASGVLYHMKDPVELLELVCASSNRIFIWTHYYDAGIIGANRILARYFSAPETGVREGVKYEYARQHYKQALNSARFCGGSQPESVWLTKESIIRILGAFGFATPHVGFEHPAHPNGPSLAICAERT